MTINMKDQRIIFNLPENTTIIEIIREILKDNNLEESGADYFSKFIKNEETRTIIVRDLARLLVEKKIPEEKLAEFLAKHLEISKETAEKIIDDVKEKLIPYAKIVEVESEEELSRKREEERKRNIASEKKLSTQEIILEKIRKNVPNLSESEISPEEFQTQEKPLQGVKKVDIKDVEKSAEDLQKKREEITKPGTIGEEVQKGRPTDRQLDEGVKKQEDKYREPVE